MKIDSRPQQESLWIRARRRLAHWIWSPLPSSDWQARKIWTLETQPVPPPTTPVPVRVPHSEFEERCRIAYQLCLHSRPGSFALLATTAIRQPSQPIRRVQLIQPAARVVQAQPVAYKPTIYVPIRRDIIVIERAVPPRRPSQPLPQPLRIAPVMPVWRKVEDAKPVEEATPTRALEEMEALATSGRRDSDTLEVPTIYRKKVAAKQSKESE